MNIDQRRKNILGDQRYGFGTVKWSYLAFSEDFNHDDPPEMSLEFIEGFED